MGRSTLWDYHGRDGAYFANLAQVLSAKKPLRPGLPRICSGCQKGFSSLAPTCRAWSRGPSAHYLSYFDRGPMAARFLKAIRIGDCYHTCRFRWARRETSTTQLHIILRRLRQGVLSMPPSTEQETSKLVLPFTLLLNARNNAGQEGVNIYREFFGDDLAPERGEAKGRRGQSARKRFSEGIEGYSALQKQLAQRVAERGAVKGLDGRLIPLRKEFAALNTLIQNAGAILCKEWDATPMISWG